jgi:hypothetical protein
MASKTLSVSVNADREFIDALSVLARRKGKRMGELVRDALDKEYGSELGEILSFFASDVASKQQTLRKRRTFKSKGKQMVTAVEAYDYE